MRQGQVIPVVAIIFAVLAFGAAAYFAFTSNIGTGNVNKVTANHNTSPNTNFAVNANPTVITTIIPPTNTNTVTATNNNTNTNTAPRTVSVAEAVVQAGTYDDQLLCVVGQYQLSFEYSALRGSSKTDVNGTPVNNLEIWTTLEVPTDQLTCTSTAEGERTCVGDVTLCGTFRYATGEKPWFGHVGAYRYALE